MFKNYIYIMVFTRFFRSSYRKQASVSFKPKTTEFCSDTLFNWAIRPWVQITLSANFMQTVKFQPLFSVNFGHCFCQLHHLPQSKSCSGNHISEVKWIKTYGIHHWRLFRRSYSKLAWLGFKPMTTKFCSDALTDWEVISYTNFLFNK